MKSILIYIGLLAINFLSLNPARAQAVQRKLTIDQIEALLSEDCITGDSVSQYWKLVLERKAEAVPFLLNAVQNGPDQDKIDGLREIAKADFQRIKKFVAEGGLSELKDETIKKQALQMDEQTYVNMRINSTTKAFKERAANALIAFNDSEINKQLLQLLSSNKLDQEVRDIVQDKLKRN